MYVCMYNKICRQFNVALYRNGTLGTERIIRHELRTQKSYIRNVNVIDNIRIPWRSWDEWPWRINARLMRGKVKGKCSRVSVVISSILRENAEASHHCCAYSCTNSEAKKKDQVKYPEVSSVTFHCFPSNDETKQYAPGMSEQERRRRWIAACRLESLNVTRHTRICSKHFEGICKVSAPVRIEVKMIRDWTIFCNQLRIYNIT